MTPTGLHARHILAAVTVTAVFAASCAEPDIPRNDTTPQDTAVAPLEEADLLGDALDDAIISLTQTLTAISATLDTDATDTTTLSDAADTALDLLLFNEPAVFPAARPTTERDATGDDLLSVVLTAARQKGGVRADMVTSALRDTLAGDLGGWERDPDGMRTEALSAYGSTVAATTERVAQLDADGMRAIAWLAFARTQQSPDVIKEAFVAAQTHLEIVTISVQLANDA